MRVSLIAALGEGRVIGVGGKLPWNCSEDLRYFRERTLGRHVLMGRKTFDSLPQPLKGRKLLVLSHTDLASTANAQRVGSIQEALQTAKTAQESELFVAGGAEVYLQILPLADRLYLTRMVGHWPGDCYFPAWQQAHWRCVSQTESVHPRGPACIFEVYERIQP